jgi:transcriptional regulator with XRE-family HTH domain
MKSKAFRTFEADGKICKFSTVGFKHAITKYQMMLKSENKPFLIKDISESMANELNISVEALSNWRKGYNGPSDLERVKEVAAVLQCDYKELLEMQGGQNNMVSKDVTYEMVNTEKEALYSVIGDLLEIVECFGRTNGYQDWRVDKSDQSDEPQIDTEDWFDKIRLKMRKLEFALSSDNVKKLENLFLETKCFVDYTYHGINRWKTICKGFELQRNFDEIADDEALDMDTLLCNNDYLDDDMIEYLSKELDAYIQGRLSYDNPIEVIGYRIGAWYMEVVKNDFPELFVA